MVIYLILIAWVFVLVVSFIKDKINPDKSSSNSFDEYAKKRAYENLAHRKAAASAPKDEYHEAVQEMLMAASAPGSSCFDPLQNLPNTVEEYIDHKHGKGSYTMEDYRRDQDRKRLEEKLDENIRLQKELLDKLNKK